MVKALYELKWQYNYNLNRYYNGCNYVEEHPNEFDKYIGKIMELKKSIEIYLAEIKKEQKVTIDEILGGFKIE